MVPTAVAPDPDPDPELELELEIHAPILYYEKLDPPEIVPRGASSRNNTRETDKPASPRISRTPSLFSLGEQSSESST